MILNNTPSLTMAQSHICWTAHAGLRREDACDRVAGICNSKDKHKDEEFEEQTRYFLAMLFLTLFYLEFL